MDIEALIKNMKKTNSNTSSLTKEQKEKKRKSDEEELDKLYKSSMSKNKSKKETKKYKEEEIMKGSSELKKKGNKYTVDTELNIKEGLEPKVKRALKKSIIDETNKKIKNYKKPVGFGFKGGSLLLDDSSSDEEEPKKEEKKVDINELRNYAKMLAHLLEHIEDPKEKPDKKDYKDAKKLIDNMEKVKSIRGKGGCQSRQRTIPEVEAEYPSTNANVIKDTYIDEVFTNPPSNRYLAEEFYKNTNIKAKPIPRGRGRPRKNT